MSRAVFVLLALLAAPLQADELVVVGVHDVRGRDARGAFSGELEIKADASWSETRRYADGESAHRGRVEVVGQGLVFHEGAERRAHARADEGRTVRWRWSAEGAEHVVEQRKRLAGRLGVVRRLLQRPEGAARWILQDNLGKVDPNPDALILRSKQPSPADLVRLKERYGLKTVVSLNGDQDETATLYAPGKPPREVNRRAFIAELGLRHETFSMSASRAPSEAELRGVFRLLTDDALKPILIHCRGGSDRTGVVGAIYGIEFLGQTKAEAKQTMRQHMWAADDGTEIQGAFVDLYQPGSVRRLLGLQPAWKRWF